MLAVGWFSLQSSILLSLLRELPPESGKVHVNGTVGYMAQTPWVVSGTLQENVLFGESVKQEQYQKVLHACALYKVKCPLLILSPQTL